MRRTGRSTGTRDTSPPSFELDRLSIVGPRRQPSAPIPQARLRARTPPRHGDLPRPRELTPAQRLAGTFILAAESIGRPVNDRETQALLQHAEAMHKAKDHFETMPANIEAAMAHDDYEGTRRSLATRDRQHGVLIPPTEERPSIPAVIAATDISRSFACGDGATRVAWELARGEAARARKEGRVDTKPKPTFHVVEHRTEDHTWTETQRKGEPTILADIWTFKLMFRRYNSMARDLSKTRSADSITADDVPRLQQELAAEKERLGPLVPAFWRRVEELKRFDAFESEEPDEVFDTDFARLAAKNLSVVGTPTAIDRLDRIEQRGEATGAELMALHPEIGRLLQNDDAVAPEVFLGRAQTKGPIAAVALARRLAPGLGIRDALREAPGLVDEASNLNRPHDWTAGRPPRRRDDPAC